VQGGCLDVQSTCAAAKGTAAVQQSTELNYFSIMKSGLGYIQPAYSFLATPTPECLLLSREERVTPGFRRASGDVETVRA
jgi:hypothetical protein